jgi:hypothetical protein
MKRTFIAALTALFLSSIAFAPSVFATVPPTLQLSATGSGDNVQITVTGNPNASVLLSYVESGVGAQITSLGTTDSNGNFSDTVSSGTYGLTSGTPVAVLIGGTNGPESPTVDWPAVTSSSALALSQNAVVVNVGTSASLTASNLGSGSLYLSSNSNPAIANISLSSGTVTISGTSAGSTNVVVCEVGVSGTCPSIYISVEQAGAGQLSLSQTNASVVSGQDLPITISGGSGVYEVANNSNPSVIQASVSGSVLTLTTGSSSGSSSITVCSTDLALCGVVVASAGSASSAAVSFSTSAPAVSIGQNTTVNIYGPTGVQFYVSSNSSPNVVQANLASSVLTLTGIAQGSSTVTVCASTGACASLAITVAYSSTGGNLALSQTTLALAPGQNTIVTISGGEQPYTVSGGITGVAQETLASGALTVYGIAGGTSSVQVCSAGGGCVPLTITVSGTAAAVTTTPVVTTTTSTATTPAYDFTEYLVPGDQDAQVLALQQLLAAQGDMTATPNGYFGPATEAAVLKFQAAHDISQVGTVGPTTRAALNSLESGSVGVSDTDISTMTLSQLQAEVASLESELTSVLNRITILGG